MDFLIELMMDLVFDGMMEAAESKRISKWIRYPIAGVLILFFVLVFALIGAAAALCLREGSTQNMLFGIFMLALDLIMISWFVAKFYRAWKKRKTDDAEE